MADYDDPKTDAYYDRQLARDIKWQAEQAERKGYDLVAKELVIDDDGGTDGAVVHQAVDPVAHGALRDVELPGYFCTGNTPILLQQSDDSPIE